MVAASGRGRAHLGGRAVPVAVLTELADDLVAVHGQSEQVLLRSPARQRETVDRFGGAALAAELTGYEQAWTAFAQVDAELAEITTRARERRQEAELLRAGLAEVERVDPQPGEDEELRALTQRLEHAEELRSASGEAHRALAGDVDEAAAGGRVATSWRSWSRPGARSSRSPTTTSSSPRWRPGWPRSATSRPISRPTSPRTCRASRPTPRAWPRCTSGASELTGPHPPVRRGRRRGARLGAGVVRAACSSSTATTTGSRSSPRGTASSTPTSTPAPPGSPPCAGRRATASAPRCRTSWRRWRCRPPGSRSTCEPRPRGPHGADEVTLLLAPHSGAEPRPLARGASGGELSRVMLALEVALAGSDPVPTFVFDEVDAGVGGAAAVEIGRRLAALARTAQVVVVTHLPQVAAFADTHLVVRKADDGQVTDSGVHRVEGEDRVRELARMLAGQQESASARDHAAELLAQAGQA